MTENLLLKLEEKTMVLLAEVEELRKQVQRLSLENNSFKIDKESNARKLQDLIALLDTVGAPDNIQLITNAVGAEQISIQG